MMKPIIKKVFIILLIINLLAIILNTKACFAMTDVTNSSFWELWEPQLENSDRLESRFNIILGVISVIGAIISIGTISVIGIKTMLGSVEEKANYKQTLIPWALGAMMLFAITTVPKVIYNFTTTAVGSTSSTAFESGDGKETDYLRGYDDGINWAKSETGKYKISYGQYINDYDVLSYRYYLQEKKQAIGRLYFKDNKWEITYYKGYYDALNTLLIYTVNTKENKKLPYLFDFIRGNEEAVSEIANGTITYDDYINKISIIRSDYEAKKITEQHRDGKITRIELQSIKWREAKENEK